MSEQQFVAVYWKHGSLMEEQHPTADAAATRLWDLWCDVEGSPVAVKELNGATVMGDAELSEDRYRRMGDQAIDRQEADSG